MESVATGAEKLSIEQLEKILRSKRLSTEKSHLQNATQNGVTSKGTSWVGNVTQGSVEAIGPMMYLDLIIEGFPVKAVVDSSAQSTIVSWQLLHEMYQLAKKHRRDFPQLSSQVQHRLEEVAMGAVSWISQHRYNWKESLERDTFVAQSSICQKAIWTVSVHKCTTTPWNWGGSISV